MMALALAGITLTGCGGGGGDAPAARLAKITVSVQWPGSSSTTRGVQRAGRVIPQAGQFFVVAVYNGSSALAAGYASAVPGQASNVTLNVPLAAGQSQSLTFYADVYSQLPYLSTDTTAVQTQKAEAFASTYENGVYNPTTQKSTPVELNGTYSIAHASLTQTVGAGATVALTLNNTIASIALINNNYQLVLGGSPLDLDDPAVVVAKDANGDTIPFNKDDSELTFAIDNSDGVSAQHASISGTTLTPLAVGAVHVVVTDKAVNSGQPSITGSLTFQVVNPGTVDIALDPSAVATTPLYAGSVQLRITQLPLGSSDNPPAAQTFVFPVTFIPGSPSTVSVATTSVPFTFTGRQFNIQLSAWTGTAGSGTTNAGGVEIASTTSATIASLSDGEFTPPASGGKTYTFKPSYPVFAAGDYLVQSFAITPNSTATPGDPTLYYFGQTPPAGLPASLPTSVALQVTFTAKVPGGGGTATSGPLDPRTVTWSLASGAPNWLTVSNAIASPIAGTVATTGTPAGAATPTAISSPVTATVQVKDAAGFTGTGTLLIDNGSPSFGFK
jgi:hypothetical protein